MHLPNNVLEARSSFPPRNAPGTLREHITSFPSGAPRACKPQLESHDIEHFVAQARDIATDITNFKATYDLNSRFSRLWKDTKALVDPRNVEEAKATLRAQNCSEFFVEAVDTFIRMGMKCSEGQQRMRVARFLISLRLAIHLSSDKGAEIYQFYNTAFHPEACPRPHPLLVRAYEAYKVRATMTKA